MFAFTCNYKKDNFGDDNKSLTVLKRIGKRVKYNIFFSTSMCRN